jgi:hypothetical protein
MVDPNTRKDDTQKQLINAKQTMDEDGFVEQINCLLIAMISMLQPQTSG